MGKRNNIHKVIPIKKFVGAVEQDLYFQITLDGTDRGLVQGDRTVDINLDERFNKERQNISRYRLYGKVEPIVDNCYNGVAVDIATMSFNTLLFQDLFYNQPASSPWPGYPQFNEFDFKRNDVDESVSTTTNWSMYVTYPSTCDGDKDMWYQSLEDPINNSVKFISSDGIAFQVSNVVEVGRNVCRFVCSAPHGLKKREFVEIMLDDGQGNVITFTTTNTNVGVFPILNLGDGTRDSKENVFNLNVSVGTVMGSGNSVIQIPNGTMGTMKRVINPNIPNSKSRYYVKEYTVLTKMSDAIIDVCGFERRVFPDVKQVDKVTPSSECRVSIKNEYPTYLYNFSKDIDVERLRDNLGRPLSSLYVSVILRNDLGYFDYTPNIGWDWNFPYSFIDSDVINHKMRGHIGDPQPVSGVIVDVVVGGVLNRGEELRVGDVLRGGFCEYNEYELLEREISEITHKFNWNRLVFDHGQTVGTQLEGYIYKPHYEVPIRVFSKYIEYGDPQDVVDTPEWAEYWEPTKQWRWRDLHDIGFFDGDNGVDYPFMNGSHYPKRVIPFYIQRQNRSLSDTTSDNTTIIDGLTIDGCE